jgi:hypothetical protein
MLHGLSCDACHIPFTLQQLISLPIVLSTQSSSQLLEAIGAISRGDAQKASSWSGNYQDLTTAPLSCTHDDEAAGQNDVDQLEDLTLTPDLDALENILPAVNEVSFKYRHLHVCSHE